MAINFSSEPYFDDFDETKGYYRILFRPGYAVQARELNQLQTTLQNQITKFGKHVFKEGSMVIAGESGVDTKIQYVKLEPTYGGILTDTIVDEFVGRTITNGNGLEAEVIYYTVSEGSDPAALYVRYKNSGNDSVTKTFAAGDVLIDSTNTYSVQAATSSPTGQGSIASIKSGVYFIKGHFVYVEDNTIILDKFSNQPSYRIGLKVTEDTITAEEDNSLFDNAQNSFNYAAPGAHRYSITTNLIKLPVSSTEDTDFIELIRVGDGDVKKQVSKSEYSVLEETLARRTYDESGDYTVKNFEIDVREYRDNNRGQWVANRVYLSGDVVSNNGGLYVAKNSGTSLSNTPPTHTSGSVYDGPGNTGIQWEYSTQPYYNRGVHKPADSATLAQNQAAEAKLAIGLEPGKAYVKGYEIEKIVTEFVAVDKARDFVQLDNQVIPSTVGNYILITNLFNTPDVSSFVEVTLYDRLISTNGQPPASATAIGTARARLVEWHNGTIGDQTAIYKLSLFDIKMNSVSYDFSRKVKSVYVSAANNGGYAFTADISPVTTKLAGAVSISGTAVTGIGTSFQTDFVVGDYIYVNGAAYRVESIQSQVGMTLTAGPGSALSNYAYFRVSTTVYEPENSSLIFQLPYYAIKDVRSALFTNDTIYTVYEKFSASVTTGKISISTASGTLASAAETDNYIIVDNTTGAIVSPTSIAPSGSGASITVSTALNGHVVTVIAAVNKSGSVLTEKQKTLVAGATVAFTTQATAQKTELLLGHADGYRIVSVMMKSGTFASPGSTYSIDITDRYEFDNGQRSTHYDQARLVLRNSYAPPEAPIQVTYDYFNHSTGDYFTVNSYPSNVDYKATPYYKGIPLRDCIDFRPRINDAGNAFSGTGAVTALVPKRGIDVVTDFTYYLPRKTKIAVDFGGNFFAIDGVSSLNPGDPLDPALGLVLYNLMLEPYTFGASTANVKIDRVDNKRYTMRDIGRLEKRIDNLEYYTSLSLLEQQTESLEVIDANGDSRFKNGFIVDGFTGHDTGDITSTDYMCAIDMERAELRPFFAMNNVNLLEKNSNNTQRTASNYKLYGDVITLPVTDHVAIVNQPYASRLENINPFAVFTFLGDVMLTPSSDDWFEVDRRPDLVVDVEGNFQTVKNIAEEAGVLGTVWNAWQTQWTGTPVSTGPVRYTLGDNRVGSRRGDVRLSKQEAQSRFGITDWGNSRQITVESTATQIGQSRTGVKTTLVSRIDKQVVGDRVLSTALIPYMRSRNILVQIQKLKPNTRFYAFFDGVDISSYCTPASKIVYSPTSGTFDAETNVGGLGAATARRIDGDSQVCLTKGDVITGGTSGATAVVVSKEYNADTNTYALYVVNIIGTFSTNETITGSVSAAQGTVTSVTTKAAGSNLITNINGEIQLLFNIPNTDALRFRCGTRELKLVDVSTVDGDFTSRARANYRAEGVLETRQQTVNAVRNAELVEERLVENRVIVQTSDRIVSDTGWWDPLAQTFLIDQKGGCFLSKIDVFFATKDDKIPVMLELREVVNGYPGKRVLPFSRVTLKPEQVNISANTVAIDGVTVNKYDTPTTFTFPSPVYVEENTEYAVVLASDSNAYKVWVSQVGETMPGTARTISEQPYLGSLFKSQNASTWTADQTQDLKFVIYRAQFDTSVTANIEYVNDVVPLQQLDTNPFETRNGTNKVRVWQKDHGMPANSKVTISPSVYGNALTGTITTSTSTTTVTGSGTSFTTQLEVGTVLYKTDGTYIGKIASVSSNTAATLAAKADVAVTATAVRYVAAMNNIPANELYTTHTISDVDLDSYVVTVTTSANASGYTGGNVVRATRNLQFDAIQPSVQIQTFSETPVEFGVKTTTGKSVDSTSQVAYVQESSYTGILANETNNFFSPRMIASELNENNFTGGNKSLTMNVTMSSTNNALSPILDTHRTSLIVINNKVNNPSETNMNVANLDYNTVLSANTTIAFSGSTISTANTTARAALASLTVGKYVTISGAANAGNNGTFLVTAISAGGTSITVNGTLTTESAGSAVTIVERVRFVDEIAAEESSGYSKYVTKRVNLSTPSTYLRVRFGVNLPAEANVEVYYKTAVIGDNASFDTLRYTKMNSDSVIPNYSNSTDMFVDVTFSQSDMPAFDAVKLKIVMKSVNSSEVPRIKDLRVIACA